MSVSDEEQEIIDHANAMRKEVGGACGLEFYPFAELEFICLAAALGNQKAGAVVRGAEEVAKRAQTDDVSKQKVCLTCDNRFDAECGPGYFVLIVPHLVDPSNFMVSGVCEHCVGRCSGAQELRDIAAASLRRSLMPDLRIINLHGAVGNA